MASRFGTLSGKAQVLGHGIPQTFPIQLDPAPFEGALVYADNGELRYSDGTSWLTTGTGPQGLQGTTGIQGVQGLQGEYGPGFTIIGSITGPGDQSTLNTAFPSAVVGDGVIDQSNDTLWIYDGSTWVNIGSFRGVQGFAGIQGTQGVQGTLGNEGIQGERGHRGFQGSRGVQGFQGIQGNTGIQGIQGRRGPQGVQGITGIQGDLGFQGTQGRAGPQGVQGTTGIQGFYGIQGFTGSYGGVSFEFDFDLTTVAQDPTVGKFAINSAAASSATALFIDSTAKQSKDISALLNSIDQVTGAVKGYIQATRISDTSQFITYEITQITDNSGWFTVLVNHVGSTGAVLTNVAADPAFILSFVRSGVQGVQGPTGSQGVQGVQGLQGVIGPQGTQGVQGTTGIQGDTGTQGVQGTQGVLGNQGVQGIQGMQGTQGNTGDFGGITYNYDYENNTTDADPGVGKLRFSATSLNTSGIKLWIDDQEKGAINVMDAVSAEFDAIIGTPKGYMRIIDATNHFNQTLFKIAAFTDKTGYWELDLVYIAGVTTLTNGVNTRVTFSRNGDRGIQGLQGVQGLQGDFGPQGTQGHKVFRVRQVFKACRVFKVFKARLFKELKVFKVQQVSKDYKVYRVYKVFQVVKVRKVFKEQPAFKVFKDYKASKANMVV